MGYAARQCVYPWAETAKVIVLMCERLCSSSPYLLVLTNTQNHLHRNIRVAYTLVVLPHGMMVERKAWGSELRMFSVATCHHISWGHTDRTMTILSCGLLFFSKKERSGTHRVVFVLIHKTLDLMVLLLPA